MRRKGLAGGLRDSFCLLLATPSCEGCGRAGVRLCRTCMGSLPRPSPVQIPSPAASVVCATAYAGGPRSLVLALKLRRDRDAAVPLARLMSDALIRAGVRPRRITWVPGRDGDIRARGFDHAEVLARQVACLVRVPHERLLRRSSRRPDQAGLSRSERLANAAGAFHAAPGQGHVVLVDDVLTTGATASACAGALSSAGYGPIHVLVACRS